MNRPLPVPNLAALVFRPLNHRDEGSEVILSHDGPALVRVSLSRLRFLVSGLMGEFRRKGILPGTTVLLASVSGGNEMFVALTFIALAAFGVRTLLPMFVETGPLDEWLDLAGCAAVIVPGEDIASLERHDKQKAIVLAIQEAAARRGLPCFDALGDFGLRQWLLRDMPGAGEAVPYGPGTEAAEAMASTSVETEALIVTTSGTSGGSKLVVYEQGAFLRNCLSWQEAGFYAPGKLGGRGFTPLFTHTMGVRAFFNALWTGSPVCLINTEWFEEKPETVRYFLLGMMPEHITGGPAVFNMLLEFSRNFPELKDRLKASLKTVVLSGARGDGRTARAVETAFGLPLHNAFGMTETQQVLSTLLCEGAGEDDLRSLGRPLPGVALDLASLPEEPGLCRLRVKSPFGCKSILGEGPVGNPADGFFDTGDIVRVTVDGRLYYEGRDGRDFIKDGFGVKVPLASMAGHYAGLHAKAAHVEYFPMRSSPGLAALVFLGEETAAVPEVTTDRAALGVFSKLAAETGARLYTSLEPFEFRHRVIRRLAVARGTPPRTGKGSVSRQRIESEYRETIAALTDPQAHSPGVEPCGDGSYAPERFTRFLNPYVGGMLAGLRMDHCYHRASKDSLFTFEDGREVEVLDLAGGYGANILGHNNPDLRAAAVSYLEAGEIPLSDQGSIQEHAGKLAEELATTVGEATGRDYAVLLANSGSEAVEVALHHAAFEWRKKLERMEEEQRQRFGGEAGGLVSELWEENRKAVAGVRLGVVTLKSSFHGHSSGPRSLLGSDEQREMFANIAGLVRIPVDDETPGWREELDRRLAGSRVALRRVVAEGGGLRVEEFGAGTVIAALAEPVIGEGGVRAVDPKVLRHLGGFEFPLVIDEIQCGLGRTGSFLASCGVAADYYLFGKALGGNIEKAAAVLIDRKRFHAEFGKYYVSTFANGGLAARVALKSLAVIKADRVPERAERQGAKLREKFEDVRRAFPDVVAEIAGRGLMIGVRFADLSACDDILFRTLAARKLTGCVFASYLLRRSRVRVLPTLSAPDTLRLEPSAYITDEEIGRAALGFEDLARTVGERRAYDLFRPLMDGDPFDDNKGGEARPGLVHSRIDEPAPGAVRVAFVAHFSRPADELRLIEKDFSRASDTGLRILFGRLQSVMDMKPFVLYAKNLFRGRVHFSFISLPADSAELERLHRLGKTRRVVARVQEAVDLAARGGAAVIGLGGYASILSRNGLGLVEPPGTRIVTGNTLTAASGLFRLGEEIRKLGRGGGGLTLGIVGASGNIGAIVTECLVRADGLFGRVVLMDRNLAKLVAFASGLDRGGFAGTIETAADLRALRECDVVAVAANTNDPIVFPHHLKRDGPVVIADVSVPSALAPAVARLANVRTLPFASYVELPEDPDFVISSHTPKGAAFCCAAEAMLCGLDPPGVPLKGKITAEAIEAMTALARKHGLFRRTGVVAGFRPEREP